MTEEEIITKQKELEEREGELKTKEEGLNEREAAISKREADASSIAETIKKEFEDREEAQKKEFEERLKTRDEMIKQLAAGEDNAPAQPSFIERMNQKREMQNKKW